MAFRVLTPLLLRFLPRPLPLSVQRALLRTAQEVAKGMGYIHEFNIGEFNCASVLHPLSWWRLL